MVTFGQGCEDRTETRITCQTRGITARPVVVAIFAHSREPWLVCCRVRLWGTRCLMDSSLPPRKREPLAVTREGGECCMMLRPMRRMLQEHLTSTNIPKYVTNDHWRTRTTNGVSLSVPFRLFASFTGSICMYKLSDGQTRTPSMAHLRRLGRMAKGGSLSVPSSL